MSHSAAPPASPLNLRYIALLVAAALMLLVVGALLRPRSKEIPAVPTNELATLPERAQRRTLDDLAEYLLERAASVGASVVHLPELGTTGVRLGGDSVLTARAGPAGPEFVVATPAPALGVPATGFAGVDTLTLQWTVAVARAPDGRRMSLPAPAGRPVPVRCGELAIRELTVGAAPGQAFAGAGLFNLDGNLLALGVPCGGRIAFVPLADARRALAQQAAPAARLWSRLGLRVEPGADSGLAVVEIRIGGPADRAGLWPGDLLATASVAGLAAFAESLGEAPLSALRRGGRVLLEPERDPAGVSVAVARRGDAGLLLAAVPSGSAAERAGLRPGDRVAQVNAMRAPTAAALERALRAGAGYLVIERGDRRLGVRLR